MNILSTIKKVFRKKPDNIETLPAYNSVKFRVVVIDFLDNIESNGGENLARLLSTK